MNVKAKQKKVNWKQIGIIAVVVLVAGYTAGRPTLEKWFNVELPSINGENDHANHRGGGNGDSGQYKAQLPTKEEQQSEAEFFASVSGDNKTSPAGLLYTMGPKREHRVEHVMNHGHDVPGKPVHGVFEGSRLEILQMVDEAYELVKSNSRQVSSSNSRGKDAHVVDMKRNVGFEGGAKGKRNGYKKLGKIKLVLDGNRVITAFPTR